MCKILLCNVDLDPPANHTVRIFASPEEALTHICDHVLTRVESHYWSIFISGYRQIVNPSEDRELDGVAKAFWHGEKIPDAQHLYDEYAESIANSLICSICLGWYWEESWPVDKRRFGVGTDGIYVIWDHDVVVSGMLPAFAEKKRSVDVSYTDRLTNPRPRSLKRPKCSVLRADTQATRYQIFKKNWLAVREEYFHACKDGRVRTSQPNFDKYEIPKSWWTNLVYSSDGKSPSKSS